MINTLQCSKEPKRSEQFMDETEGVRNFRFVMLQKNYSTVKDLLPPEVGRACASLEHNAKLFFHFFID